MTLNFVQHFNPWYPKGEPKLTTTQHQYHNQLSAHDQWGWPWFRLEKGQRLQPLTISFGRTHSSGFGTSWRRALPKSATSLATQPPPLLGSGPREQQQCPRTRYRWSRKRLINRSNSAVTYKLSERVKWLIKMLMYFVNLIPFDKMGNHRRLHFVYVVKISRI